MLHEDSPECRVADCGRLVKQAGDLCTFHLSAPDTEDEDMNARRVARTIDRSWDEYDPARLSNSMRDWHPEAL